VNRKVRIVLSDDHPIVLEGLRNLIRAERDLDLVGEAKSGLAALKLIRETEPDIAVVDISMPELNGIALSRRVIGELPSVRVIVLTSHEDQAHARQALEIGVRGYVLKRSAAEKLTGAIRAVAVGGLYLDTAIADRVLSPVLKPGAAGQLGTAMPQLTDREAEVLKFIAFGLSNKEISAQLGIGIKSVETYKTRGTDKLGLRTRAEIVRYAARQGWLSEL